MKSPFSFFKSFAFIAAGLIAASMLMVSCLKSSHDSQPQTDNAGLMIFNLVPDKAGVGVAIGGNIITTNPLAFTNYTGGYQAIYPGNRSLESFEFYSGSSLADTSQLFEKDKFYSAFVIGAAGNYRNVITLDDFDTLENGTAGQAYIRYINAIPDSTRPTVLISANGNSIVNTQAGFGQISEFVAAAPGNISIDINNGTGIDADRTITVEANKVYTVLLTGVAGSATAPVSIKYVTNGTLENEEGARAAGGSQRMSN